MLLLVHVYGSSIKLHLYLSYCHVVGCLCCLFFPDLTRKECVSKRDEGKQGGEEDEGGRELLTLDFILIPGDSFRTCRS